MDNEELEKKVKELEEELRSKNNALIYIFDKIYRDLKGIAYNNTQLEIKNSLIEKESTKKTEENDKLIKYLNKLLETLDKKQKKDFEDYMRSDK